MRRAVDAQRMTVAFLTTDDRIVTIGKRFALVALFPSDMTWTKALTGRWFAESRRRAVTWFTIGETIIASFTSFTPSTYYVIFTFTLSTEFFAFETQ